jgi:hypothetical protein
MPVYAVGLHRPEGRHAVLADVTSQAQVGDAGLA